ncbi:methylenetetrahydrofolate reductase [NAD(P)H] [Roseibacillus ishigakijimensis]|uniref:Methylenetetrahydrofolate reductase n=1 Tax=Roseibacillus ishigakijimensis TaxID=454146 RepID=A0A934RV12_9BACT|nr:methylenetetrahydrofolate reductase [NAD(P)H] [Roseibacillus ishigakijimensis]MBK1834981.1 methylenetetrahydrofolate reductase [NAD(P)H] [Roseibacillus ishigakijimensis]
MHINDLLAANQPSLSFEFFPPKTKAGAESLFQVIQELAVKKPSFVSVTYGAGGTTRDLTHDLVMRILQETPIPAVPHLTCVKHTREEIHAILTRYAEAGVGNILALRGDAPKNDSGYRREDDDFPYAVDLVRFIAEFNRGLSRPHFGIGVAGFPEGHPETPNRLQELDYFKAKIDAGADYICTQLFFDNHDLLDFRDRCELAGIHVPIIAGVMPVTSRKGMVRMAELAAGARFPAKLQRALQEEAGDDITSLGVDYATTQCEELLREGIPGIHFYTLNKSQATLQIVDRLAL